MQDICILAGLITSLTISFIAIPSIIKVAISKGLYGINRNKNDIKQKIPTLGGLAIFAGIMVSLNLFTDISELPELPYISAAAIGLFFIGLKDDILITAPWWKLLGQALAALVICIPGGLQIPDTGNLIGLPPGMETMDVLFTVLVIITIINSYNLIDGIDGLAAGIGLLASTIFGIVFWKEGLQSWSLMSATVIGSLAGFTWYNVFSRRKKIYMGDTGSLLLGFLLSIMAVRFLNIENPQGLFTQIQAPFGILIAVFFIPLFDTMRIIIVRILRGRSPFRPDRQHIHYRLVDAGLNHRQAAGLLIGINLFVLIIVSGLQSLGDPMLIGILLLIAFILSALPGLKNKSKKKN